MIDLILQKYPPVLEQTVGYFNDLWRKMKLQSSIMFLRRKARFG